MPRCLHFPALLLACFLFGLLIVPTHAHAGTQSAAPEPDPVVWPETPCRLENRMDIAVVDGLFFECTCVRLLMGHQCDWMIIAGVASRPARRIKVKAHAKRVAIHAPLPAVVA